MPKDENLHKEHRMRVRNEFLENGFSDNTPAHKVLEMLLFYSIPRKDTNEIAHRLLEHFGSIPAIFEATPSELKNIDGIGDNSVALIKLVSHLSRLYQIETLKPVKKIYSHEEICSFITKKHFGLTKEVCAITSLDNKGSIIAYDVLSIGDNCSVCVSTRTVIETVIERKATCVILSHNHPKATAIPSSDDIEMTKRLQTALSHINVRLLDHIIVSNNDYVSLMLSHQFTPIFEYKQD